jgi:hypothetical protein
VNRKRWQLATTALVAVAAVAVGIGLVARSDGAVALPDIDTLTCPPVEPAPGEAPSVPALVRLSSIESTALPGRIVDDGHDRAGRRPPLAIAAADRTAFSTQVRAAAHAACSLRTPADAERAGYVRSSFNTQGVGIHWTNWRLVDAPFDPARPSMLLYGAGGDAKLHLAGFSYWVRSARAPAGFAGGGDRWHRHFGLCFNAQGQLETEGLRDRQLCAGTWLNGTDLWMLHAWIVPGSSNTWGLFAPLNPALCARNVPDVIRCRSA